MPVVVEEGLDQGLVWHYGNPVAEARAMTAGDAVADLANRQIIEISGPDRLALLHALTTQHLERLEPGPTVALILDPNGRIEHALFGVDDGTRMLAWTEPGRADALVGFLTSMRFMMRVEISRRDDLRLLWAGHRVALEPDWVARDSELGGSDVFVPRDSALPNGTPVGTWAYEAARIAAGVPRIFVDTDHKAIPNEIGLLGTHLDKGCYRGQETVARVHTLGRPPRRLVQLLIDGSESALPAPGSPIELDGKQVGFVGSAARHHELGPVALGLIKRGVDVAATVLADGIPATQEALVDPDVGLHVRPVLR